MLAHGNGTAQQCTLNLLSMARGECPYERCKGVTPDLIGSPYGDAVGLLAEDVVWLLGNYEPRISMNSATLAAQALASGTGLISADIEVEEE